MTMLHRATERLLRALKRDDQYSLDPSYTTRELMDIAAPRLGQVMRGVLLGRKVAGRQPLFAGRRISIRKGRAVRIGRSSIIGDGVILDGLGRDGIVIGSNVTIARGSTLMSSGVVARPGIGITIGDRTGISEYCHLGGQGGLTIGEDVLMGPGVRIFTEDHVFARSDVAIRLQGEARSSVVIESDCWIGGGATILAGVRVGSGSVVGAGSVVTKDIPAGSIAVGNPARVVGSRW